MIIKSSYNNVALSPGTPIVSTSRVQLKRSGCLGTRLAIMIVSWRSKVFKIQHTSYSLDLSSYHCKHQKINGQTQYTWYSLLHLTNNWSHLEGSIWSRGRGCSGGACIRRLGDRVLLLMFTNNYIPNRNCCGMSCVPIKILILLLSVYKSQDCHDGKKSQNLSGDGTHIFTSPV